MCRKTTVDSADPSVSLAGMTAMTLIAVWPAEDLRFPTYRSIEQGNHCGAGLLGLGNEAIDQVTESAFVQTSQFTLGTQTHILLIEGEPAAAKFRSVEVGGKQALQVFRAFAQLAKPAMNNHMVAVRSDFNNSRLTLLTVVERAHAILEG
jgi:hypothetical protein